MRKFRIVFFLLLVTLPGAAQRFPERWFTLNPLFNKPNGKENLGWSVMHSSFGWGEFGAYRIVRDDEHAWIQRLGAFVEFFRVNEHSSFGFVSTIEFIANPQNDIRFNPRAIFWEEGFLFSQKNSGGSYWQAGYMHRCKHDVDNANIQRERSLIYGSIVGKYILPVSVESNSAQALLTLRTDIFTLRQDDRQPENFSSLLPNYKSLFAAAGYLFHVRASSLPPPFGLYGTIWSSLNMYGTKQEIFLGVDNISSVLFQGGIGGGISVEGNARLRIGISYEYSPDTGINPFPEHAHLLALSITITPMNAIW